MDKIFDQTLHVIRQTQPKIKRHLTQIVEDYNYLGTKYKIPNKSEAYLNYHKEKNSFSASLEWYFGKEDYDLAKELIYALQKVIQKTDLECFIFPIVGGSTYPPGEIMAHGEKARNTLHLMDYLNEHYDVNCSRAKAEFETERAKYNIRWDIEIESIIVENIEKGTEVLKTKTDINDFVQREKDIHHYILKSEQSIIQYMQQLDPTSYYHQTPSISYVYIFGVKVPFGITKLGASQKPKFKLTFEKKQKTAGTLVEIEMQAKEKIKMYINKHRLKAVTSRNYDIVERHLAFMFGKRTTKARFLNGIISEIDSSEILDRMKKARPDEIQVLEPTKREVFEKEIKKRNTHFKLKSSFQIQDLLLFITASRYFVFKEGEL